MKFLKAFFQFCFVSSLFLLGCTKSNEPTDQSDEVKSTESFNPQIQYGILVNNLFIEHYQVKKNQQFADLLHGNKVSQAAWMQLNTLPRKQFDFRRVVAGKPYTLLLRPDSVCSLKALVYEMSMEDYVIFHFSDSLRLEFCQKEITTAERTVSGVIENNLSETISRLGISHVLTNRVVDILGWQIDFYRLQKGDELKIVYEEKLVDGKAFAIGAISGIYFKHADKDYWALPFDQGEGTDYFDRAGNSIRRALLKYPIEFTHISSRYSMNRFHPVLKENRPHLGTDLSAAMGTPIRSVGEGTIVEAGYNAGNGNYVKVRHNATYSTGYLHMSRISNGIRVGVLVSQAQVIGFVGSTGWATGPHLCYRFWKNGVQVDALRVVIPPAKPVKKEMLANYECAITETVNKINNISKPSQSVVASR